MYATHVAVYYWYTAKKMREFYVDTLQKIGGNSVPLGREWPLKSIPFVGGKYSFSSGNWGGSQTH